MKGMNAIPTEVLVINAGDTFEWQQPGNFAPAPIPSANGLTAATIINHPKIRAIMHNLGNPAGINEQVTEVTWGQIVYACKRGYQDPIRHRVEIRNDITTHPSFPNTYNATTYKLKISGLFSSQYSNNAGFLPYTEFQVITPPVGVYTIVQLHAAFVAQINADVVVSKYVTASLGGTTANGIVITANNSNRFYSIDSNVLTQEVFRFDAYMSADIVPIPSFNYPAAGTFGIGNPGSGTFEMCNVMERNARAWNRTIWLDHSPDTSYAFKITAGKKYDTFCIRHAKNMNTVSTGTQTNNVIDLIIYVEANPTDVETAIQAQLETPLSAWLVAQGRQIETVTIFPSGTPADSFAAPTTNV